MSQNVLYTIQQKLSGLPAAEQRIGTFILANSGDVLNMNVQTLAHASKASPSSVIRFSKRICNQGFPQLKILLSANRNVSKKLYSAVAASDSLPEMKEKLEIQIGHTISETNQAIDDKALKACTQWLHWADTVYVYGMGASHVVSEDFDQKFTRIGKNIVQTLDTHLLGASLVAGSGNNLLVLISNSGSRKEGVQLAELAKAQHIPIIVLTSNRQSELASYATNVLLHDSGGENGEIRTAATMSLMSQLYTVDLLYYSFYSDRIDENSEKIRKSYVAVENYFLKD